MDQGSPELGDSGALTEVGTILGQWISKILLFKKAAEYGRLMQRPIQGMDLS
jgi:hypothetical protein